MKQGWWDKYKTLKIILKLVCLIICSEHFTLVIQRPYWLSSFVCLRNWTMDIASWSISSSFWVRRRDEQRCIREPGGSLGGFPVLEVRLANERPEVGIHSRRRPRSTGLGYHRERYSWMNPEPRELRFLGQCSSELRTPDNLFHFRSRICCGNFHLGLLHDPD